MSSSSSAVKDEPGSMNGDVPMTKQALTQKRTVRDLNTRLEMYVRAQGEKDRVIDQLKKSLAKQEMEYRNKLKYTTTSYTETIEKQRKDIENLVIDNKCTHQELNNANSAKKEFEDRLIASESRNAALSSECDTLRQEIGRMKTELDRVRKQYATLKYQHDTYQNERQSFDEKMEQMKIKQEQLLRELTQKETNLKTDKETFERMIVDKNDEIERLRAEIKTLEMANNTTQSRLRQEFDGKLAEFVQKREEQYKQEKDEWMRIFKEEFNRKLRSFKEANQELSRTNCKQSQDISDLRARISKLKQQKTELEVQNRNSEEENEKLRTDLDELRRQKDEEIKAKNALILQERDRFKAIELEFDELAGIKLQLDSEIELYRNILNEAEASSGYQSPLAFNENTNNGKRGRKRRRYNDNRTPMGPLINNTNSSTTTNNKEIGTDNNNNKQLNDNNNTGNGKIKVLTPGIVRAAQNAQKDLKSLRSDGSVDVDEEEEVKQTEEEDNDEFDVDETYITPGNLEGSTLGFSGLDLNDGMIEIQNMGETTISLNGYKLSNDDRSKQLELPPYVNLQSKEKLRIYVGKKLSDIVNDEEKRREIIGDYLGAYVFWETDVWTGSDRDCAKLYNPNQQEITNIQISPEMVPKSAKSNGCSIM